MSVRFQWDSTSGSYHFHYSTAVVIVVDDGGDDECGEGDVADSRGGLCQLEENSEAPQRY